MPSGSRATIMELLWVDVTVRNTDLIGAGDEVDFTLSMGSVPTGIQRLGNPICIANVNLDTSLVGAASALLVKNPIRYSFQDKNGFGYLYAGDSFNVAGLSTGQAAAVQYQWRLYYRFVNVSITEYVGIVQSQQST